MSDRSTSAITTRGSVLVALAVNSTEAIALGVAAAVTGSVALRAQTATSAADVAVALFLLIGVLSGARPADEAHPLGYGREGFFWSLFAALGIFVGGGGLALEGSIQSALHPSAVGHYTVAYLVLAATFALDAYALNYALRPLRERVLARHTSLAALLTQSTDPASTTVVLGGGCAVAGAVTAASGLIASQITGDATPDIVAGALIGLLLLAASVVLLHANRELLTGRGVAIPMLDQMRRLVAAQHGIIDVPDLFAVVVGPSSLIVIGDVTFADELDVPAVEETIMRSAEALRERWPSVHYVYLTPVPRFRLRRPDGEATRPGRNAAPPRSGPVMTAGNSPNRGRSTARHRGFALDYRWRKVWLMRARGRSGAEVFS